MGLYGIIILKMKKIIIMIMIIMMLPAVMSETLKIYPSDDAFVRDSYPNTNFNSASWKSNLRAGYENSFGTDQSYLKFDLNQLQGKVITSAVFSIFAISKHDNPEVNLHYASNDNWDENTIIWNNKPSHNSLVDSNSVSSVNRKEFDVNSIIDESDGELSLVLVEDGGEGFVNFYSKDLFTGSEGDENYWPYLEIEYEGGSCNTDADTNCNGCVEMTELLNFIQEWKIGNTTMTKLLESISKWKTAEGCI